MQKTYKYRMYPNTTTEKKLQWVLDRCRELYNAALQERKEAWDAVKRHPNFYDEEIRKEVAKEHTVNYYTQQNDLPEIKQMRPEYQEIGSHVLQNVIKRVDLTFQAFFRRVRNGEIPGYPRYQGRQRYDSFCYPDKAGWKFVPGKKQHAKLVLAKIGTVEVRMHRPIEGTIKTCSIKREGEHWYVVFACEVQPVPHLPYTDDEVGIDLGVLHLATLSTGDTIENPKYYRKGAKKLAKAQQSLARKKRGSHRRKKAVQKVARCHRKVRNQRGDYLHKQSRQLVDTYQTLVFEQIQPANLSRRAKPKQDEETGVYLPNGATAKSGLNKSILDAGWSQFIAYCTYKAVNAGTVQVVQVDPRYTSQICSGCGTVVKKELSERWHSCNCGVELDRDHNAAINILHRYKQQPGAGSAPRKTRRVRSVVVPA